MAGSGEPLGDGAPDSAGPDPRGELLELTRALSAYVEWQAATGATGLPRGDASEVPSGDALPPAAEAREERRRQSGAAPALRAESGRPAPPRADSARSVAPAELERSAPSAASARAPASEEAVVPPVEAPPPPALEPTERARRLALLEETVRTCTRCALAEGRTQTVFARGSGANRLCFVGEGPGADEDEQGFPFVGPAGQLLDRMISAMGLSRDEVYVANIVKCRPPKNRKPEPEEMAACIPYLAEQLELIEPEVIVALGATAVQGLFGTSEGITRLRGKWKLYRGRVPVMPTFHPAYLLRTPSAKREVWDDLQAVLRQMGRAIPKSR